MWCLQQLMRQKMIKNILLCLNNTTDDTIQAAAKLAVVRANAKNPGRRKRAFDSSRKII